MPCDVDDIRQDLRADVLQRLAGFNPAKSQRHSFVAMVITRAVATMLEHCKTTKRGFGRFCMSLNEMVRDGEGNEVELYQTIDAQIGKPGRSGKELRELTVDVRAVVNRLPADQRALCRHLRTMNISEAAHAMGIPRTTLNDLARKVRAAFKEAGLRDYLRES
jgi:DNA-directed RNA polymerase specialized sigma24 family protein